MAIAGSAVIGGAIGLYNNRQNNIDSLPDNYFPSNPPPFPNNNDFSPNVERLIPPNVETGTKPFPGNIDNGRPQVETFPGNSCPANLVPPFFESSEQHPFYDLPNLNNDPDYVNLKKQLQSEEQLGESGITILGTGSAKGTKPDIPLRDAPRLANEYGGNPSDWVKKTSSAVNAPDGTHLEIHWYENIKTGQRVEPKTVINP